MSSRGEKYELLGGADTDYGSTDTLVNSDDGHGANNGKVRAISMNRRKQQAAPAFLAVTVRRGN
jgi:hypothetical protein